jgi:hypothetical protein
LSVVGLTLPHLDAAHRLQPIVGAYARRRAAMPDPALDAPLAGAWWPASFFGLDRVSAFARADADRRAAVLAECAQGLVGEAYAVEKMGMAYCARLGLLARSAEERIYYAHVGADEATHLAWVTPYVRDPAEAVGGPFVALVAGAVEAGERNALVYLMQVVLEGWGLTHYRRLAAACEAPALRARLRRVLRDEAAHHGGGRVLFEPGAVGPAEAAFVRDYLRAFLGMVRAGPQSVVGALERGLGGRTRAERARAFAELDAAGHAAGRLALLRGLMTGHGLDGLVQGLADEGAFTPLAPEACADLFEAPP